MNETMKLIISQRYVKKTGGSVASLEDLHGNNVLVKSENGMIEMIAIENFKRLYTMALAL